MKIEKLKVRPLLLALVMSLTLATPEKCEAVSNNTPTSSIILQFNAYDYDLMRLIDCLEDPDLDIPFEKTDHRISTLMEQAQRFEKSYKEVYLREDYPEDTREFGRTEANAGLFYVSKQVFSNLVADYFGTDMGSINVKHERNPNVDHDYYTVIVRANGSEMTFFVDPEFNGRHNDLYTFIRNMEAAYNHKLSDSEESKDLGDAYNLLRFMMMYYGLECNPDNNTLGVVDDYNKVMSVAQNNEKYR